MGAQYISFASQEYKELQTGSIRYHVHLKQLQFFSGEKDSERILFTIYNFNAKELLQDSM
jgi:hypothetical protein